LIFPGTSFKIIESYPPLESEKKRLLKGVNFMDMKSEIRKLARLEESSHPFCSLYLNTKWDDEQQRERAGASLRFHT